MFEAKSPLNIYVFWHNEYKLGSEFANEFYSCFTRNVNEPHTRGIGIPIYYINQHEVTSVVMESSPSEKSIFIVLIEDNMTIDGQWKECIENVSGFCDEDSKSRLIIPIAMTSNAYNFSSLISPKNYIRYYESISKSQLLLEVTHEICRLLYGVNRISEIDSKEYSAPPIKLFISHAKEDGLTITKNINSFIQNETKLDTFFDSNDIAIGNNFSNEIECNIGESVLLVIKSDKYASREWCRKEILIAKKYNKPIIILDTLEHGEDRSFPYMANVRTMRVSAEINHVEILTNVLVETLKHKYQHMYISYLLKKYEVVLPTTVLSYPPELLTLTTLAENESRNLIYPDPPLSDEEIDLLSKYSSSAKFITATQIPSNLVPLKNKRLKNSSYRIGISISESKDISQYGLSDIHLQDFMSEIARYLLAMGCNLGYGGDIQQENYNFVETLFNLAASHNKDNKNIPQKITNFILDSNYKKIDASVKAKLKAVAYFHEVKSDKRSEDFLVIDNNIAKAINLSMLRTEMDQLIDGRIILGGKASGFSGKIAGILEEAYITLTSGKPLFVLGACGGVSKLVGKCLLKEISIEKFIDHFNLQKEEKAFISKYNNHYLIKPEERIDYEKIYNFILDKGITALNNGLSEEENKKLINTTNTHESIALVVKGLYNIK